MKEFYLNINNDSANKTPDITDTAVHIDGNMSLIFVCNVNITLTSRILTSRILHNDVIIKHTTPFVAHPVAVHLFKMDQMTYTLGFHDLGYIAVFN